MEWWWPMTDFQKISNRIQNNQQEDLSVSSCVFFVDDAKEERKKKKEKKSIHHYPVWLPVLISAKNRNLHNFLHPSTKQYTQLEQVASSLNGFHNYCSIYVYLYIHIILQWIYSIYTQHFATLFRGISPAMPDFHERYLRKKAYICTRSGIIANLLNTLRKSAPVDCGVSLSISLNKTEKR